MHQQSPPWFALWKPQNLPDTKKLQCTHLPALRSLLLHPPSPSTERTCTDLDSYTGNSSSRGDHPSPLSVVWLTQPVTVPRHQFKCKPKDISIPELQGDRRTCPPGSRQEAALYQEPSRGAAVRLCGGTGCFGQGYKPRCLSPCPLPLDLAYGWKGTCCSLPSQALYSLTCILAVLLQCNSIIAITCKWKQSGSSSILLIFFLFILLLISQDKDFTYSISAKALTQSLSQAPVLQQMRNQTLQHLSTLRLESELEPGCFLLLKPFPKQLNK